ncbi:MAG: VanZ family protein [Ignavibacteriae bacterium]|nr:VanZ family protein [Ignavibacteriota bacterium]
MSGFIRSHFFRFRFPAFAWAIIIFIASSFPSVRLPKFEFISVDKLLHIGVFFVLGFLVFRALESNKQEQMKTWKRVVVSSLLSISYGVADEVHQSFVPGRHLDKYDMLADAIGALAAVGISYFFLRRRFKKLSTY